MDGSATSPLRSQGSPNKGTKLKVAQKWAKVLHHRCVLEDPLRKKSETKVAHKRAEVLNHPYLLGGAQTRRQS